MKKQLTVRLYERVVSKSRLLVVDCIYPSDVTANGPPVTEVEYCGTGSDGDWNENTILILNTKMPWLTMMCVADLRKPCNM